MRWKGKGQRPNRLTHRLRPWISQSQKQRHPTPLRAPREGAPPGLEAEQQKTPRQQRRQGKKEPIPAKRASVPAKLQPLLLQTALPTAQNFAAGSRSRMTRYQPQEGTKTAHQGGNSWAQSALKTGSKTTRKHRVRGEQPETRMVTRN